MKPKGTKCTFVQLHAAKLPSISRQILTLFQISTSFLLLLSHFHFPTNIRVTAAASLSAPLRKSHLFNVWHAERPSSTGRPTGAGPISRLFVNSEQGGRTEEEVFRFLASSPLFKRGRDWKHARARLVGAVRGVVLQLSMFWGEVTEPQCREAPGAQVSRQDQTFFIWQNLHPPSWQKSTEGLMDP